MVSPRLNGAIAPATKSPTSSAALSVSLASSMKGLSGSAHPAVIQRPERMKIICMTS